MPCVGRDGAAAGRALRRGTSGSHPHGRRASGTPGPPDGHVLRPHLRVSYSGRAAGGPGSRRPTGRQTAPCAGLATPSRFGDYDHGRDAFRRLSQAEQLERRRQGLCYNCDEPYAQGHVCPRLFYLEMADYVEEDAPADGLGELPPPAAAKATPAAAPATTRVVSLHALASIRDERTMLLPVIHGERLVALLDTGSTHNFLPKATMRHLALQPTGREQFGSRWPTATSPVSWARAERDHHYRRRALHHHMCRHRLGLLRLHPRRRLLADPWSHPLGLRRPDDDLLASRPPRPVGGHGGASLATSQLQLAATTTEAEHPLLDHLLQQHGDLFDESRGLPPARVYDHRIHLLPGSAPVAVWPYRYPQLQKDELERQCALMLALGIIRISTSRSPCWSSSASRTTRGVSASTTAPLMP
ncbi:hypothetical protein ACQJBY_028274 [Aegilops geniculata]